MWARSQLLVLCLVTPCAYVTTLAKNTPVAFVAAVAVDIAVVVLTALVIVEPEVVVIIVVVVADVDVDGDIAGRVNRNIPITCLPEVHVLHHNLLGELHLLIYNADSGH